MPNVWSRRLVLAALLAGGAGSGCMPAATVNGTTVLPATVPGGIQQPAVNVPPVSTLSAIVVFPAGSLAKLQTALRTQAASPPAALTAADLARLRITVNGTVLSASQFAFSDLQLDGQGQLTASLRMTGLTPLQAAAVEIATASQGVLLKIRVPLGGAANPFRLDLRSTALALIAEAAEKLGATAPAGPADETAVANLIAQLQEAYAAGNQTDVLQKVEVIASSVQNGHGNGHGAGGVNGGPGGPNAGPTVVFPAGAPGTLFTAAGGHDGDGGPGPAAPLTLPGGTAVDGLGNLYISDQNHHRVRLVCKVAGTYFGQAMTVGNIYTVAGGGPTLGDGNVPTQAALAIPAGLAVDAAGNLFINDSYHYRLRMVPVASGTYFGQAMTAGRIYSVAGTGSAGQTADDSLGTASAVDCPYRPVAIDPDGHLCFTELGVLRLVARQSGTYYGQAMTAGRLYTIAGSPTSGTSQDGTPALGFNFLNIDGLAVDTARNLFITDSVGNGTYMIPATTGSHFGKAMTANQVFRLTGITGQSLGLDPAGNLYISGNTPLTVLPKTSGTLFGQAVTANVTATLSGPSGHVAIDGDGNLHTSVANDHKTYLMPGASGTYFGQTMTANTSHVIAGASQPAATGDGGPATRAGLSEPAAVAADARGSLYIGDSFRIRMVSMTNGTAFGRTVSAGTTYTIAGTGTLGHAGDGGPATAAQLYTTAVAADAQGNVAFSQTDQNTVRFIPAQGGSHFGQSLTAGSVTTLAGAGASTADGIAASTAALSNPNGLAYDLDGHLLIAETNRHRVRALARSSGTYYGQAMTAGQLYTIAGDGGTAFGGNGATPTATGVANPNLLTVDGSGNLVIGAGHFIYLLPKAAGTAYGQTMTAGKLYLIGGNSQDVTPPLPENVPATSVGTNGGMGGLAVDAAGNVYFSDTYNFRLRRINLQGQVATVAGSGDLIEGQEGDGFPGLSGMLHHPRGLAYSPLWRAVLFTSGERVRGLFQ